MKLYLRRTLVLNNIVELGRNYWQVRLVQWVCGICFYIALTKLRAFLMRLLERYTETFSIEISQPKDRIILALKKLTDKPKRNILADRLFYGEVYKLTDNSFEIIKRKAFFDAYGASGKIAMKFLPSDNLNHTKIIFLTNPLKNNDDAIGYLVFLFFLIVWTIVSLLISVNFYTILIAILGWTIFPLIMHVWLQWNKIKLRDYANSFVKKYLQQ